MFMSSVYLPITNRQRDRTLKISKEGERVQERETERERERERSDR